MAKEGVDESTAQSMLYTGGYTIEATVNPKIQTAMEKPDAQHRRRLLPGRLA